MDNQLTSQSSGSMDSFFAVIDHGGAFLNCAEMIANSMDASPSFADSMTRVRKWMRTPVDQRSSDLLQLIKLPAVKPLFDGQPAASALFGATIFQAASTILATPGAFAKFGERLQDSSTVDAINSFIAKNSCAEILIESALRANRNKKFMKLLHDSMSDLEEFRDALQNSSGGQRIMHAAAREKADPTEEDGGAVTGPGTEAQPRGTGVGGCTIGSSSTKGQTATCVAYAVATVFIAIGIGALFGF